MKLPSDPNKPSAFSFRMRSFTHRMCMRDSTLFTQCASVSERTHQIDELARCLTAVPDVDHDRYHWEVIVEGKIPRLPIPTDGDGLFLVSDRALELSQSLDIELTVLMPDVIADAVQEKIKARLGELGSLYPHWTRLEAGLISMLQEPSVASFRNWQPSSLQLAILQQLDGKATTKEQLLEKGLARSGTDLYRKNRCGGLWELMQLHVVENDRKLGGYYRPDHAPTVRN